MILCCLRLFRSFLCSVAHGCFPINASAVLSPLVSSSQFGTTLNLTEFSLPLCLARCSQAGFYLAAPYNSTAGSGISCGCLHDFQQLGKRNDQLCSLRCGNVSCGGSSAVSVFTPPGMYGVDDCPFFFIFPACLCEAVFLLTSVRICSSCHSYPLKLSTLLEVVPQSKSVKWDRVKLTSISK